MYAIKKDDAIILFDRTNYILTSVDYGAVSASHYTAKGINQVGARIISTTLDARDVEIIGFIKATSAQDMEEKKATLYQMCDPRSTFEVMPTSDLALECRTTSTVKFSSSKLTNNERVASFVIDGVCHDPLFRDAVTQYKKIVQWEPNLIWPLEIPEDGFCFSRRTDSMIATLTNEGDVETGMLVYFAASVAISNPILTNVSTGEYLKLNHDFVAGETVVVNTNYGQESATSYIGDTITDVINSVDLDSTFLQVPLADTQFHFTADSNENSMTITLCFYQKYLGV